MYPVIRTTCDFEFFTSTSGFNTELFSEQVIVGALFLFHIDWKLMHKVTNIYGLNSYTGYTCIYLNLSTMIQFF